MAEFTKLVKIKLDYTNWNAWRTEVVRALRVNSCAHHVNMDDGVAKGFEDLLYERPEAPASISATATSREETAYKVKLEKYEVELTAYSRAKKLRNYKRDMDGVCVANAIAATCGPALSFLVGREMDKHVGGMQPLYLWAFLEETTRSVLIPARAHLEEQMLMIRQGADETLEVYIARLQVAESELVMISDRPDVVRASMTLKLVNSVNDEYSTAVTMIKNILLTSYNGSSDEEKWMYVVGALREEEQVRIRRAARTVDHGYMANPRRPTSFGRGYGPNPTGRGFDNSGASTSGSNYVKKKCHNCKSPHHLIDDCTEPLQEKFQYRYARGGRGGRGGQGHRSSDSAMASTSMSASAIIQQITHLSAALAEIQSGSENAMSAQMRGAYLRLYAIILDSGCSRHMSPNIDMFVNYVELHVPGVVRFGGGTLAKSVGIGTLKIVRPDGSILYLQNALYVPELVATLLSVSQMTKVKCAVLFGESDDNGAYVYRKSDNKLMLSATLTNESIYMVDVSTPSGVAMFAQPAETAELWHRRMGHRSYRSLAHMQRLGLLQGCRLTPADFVQAGRTPCEPCVQAKTHRASHTTPAVKTKILLHRLIVDMKGPLPMSIDGNKYVVTITDEASGNRAVGPIANKSDAAQFVIDTIVLWETQVQSPGVHRVQRVRSDNGTEFMSDLFAYMKARGIQRELGAPYTPEQVGGAERQNRTTIEPTRAMLNDSSLAQNMWSYAIRCACILLNSSVSEGQKKSPHELFYGTQAPTLDLRVFGCAAWVMLPKPKITALGPRVRTKGIFVGYPMPLGTRQYLVLIDGVVVRSSDVQFHESQIVPVAVAPVHAPALSDLPAHAFPDDGNIDTDDDVAPTQLCLNPGLDDVQLQFDEHPVHEPDLQQLVQIQHTAPVDIVVQEIVHDGGVQLAADVNLPQTHAGRSRRAHDPGWRTAHIPGFEPALTATVTSLPLRKQRKPGWGTCRGVKERLALHVSSHRYGMQRPDLAWSPSLQSVSEHECDISNFSLPLVRPVFSTVQCRLPSLASHNAEMHTAMKAAVSSPRNFPKPGLIRTANHTDIPTCLRTSVPCMPATEPQRSLGDMSVMPRTIEEALARPDHAKWREALEVELGAMKSMKVWQTAQLPEGATAVGCRMLFDIKQPSGRYKCRLVAQGFSQVHGQDYGETYAPVAAMQTLRVFWATCAHFGLTIRQLDVSTAFLHAPLDEKVYMKQLKGLRTGSAREIWELFKAVYGLKQAPRAWNKLLSSKLLAAGWVQSDADPSLYLQYSADEQVIAAALIYVDDLQLASKDPKLVDSLVQEIMGWWPCTVQAADRFLGIQIEHDITAGTLTVHQGSYIDSMVARYECEQEFHALLPLPPTVQFSKDSADMGELLQDGNLYSSLVGSLNHLSLCTRPDISYAVSLLSRYLKCPRAAHWGAAVYLLRYVKGTRTRSLIYGADTGLQVYADASYRRGPDARSTTGYVIILHGAAVAWGSKLQAYAALSTTEAEVQAAVSAGRVAIWMGYVLPELGQSLTGPVTIQGDNQAALSLLSERRHTKMSQHMEPIDSRLRHWVAEGRLRFVYVSTTANWADCLTKALPRPALVKCCVGMGLIDTDNV